MTNVAYEFSTKARLSQALYRTARSIPTPEEDEVIVRVKACAVNPVDEQLAQSSDRLLKFMGATPLPSEQPWIPAADFSGIIHAAGSRSGWSVGEEVYGMKLSTGGQGTLQQYIQLQGSAPMTHKPTNLSFAEAASLPLVYGTVHDALIKYGKLPFNVKPEEKGKRSVLILGGSSGTGSAAIQLAKKMGLKVVTTCSGKNVDFVRGLGADEVIDYRTQHVPQSVTQSHHAPFAVVLDCVGGTELISSLEHLILHDPEAPHLGIYVTIVGDKHSRDSMGGALTNYYYPSQVIRSLRGSLNDYIPTWIPLRSWIATPRYACIMLNPTREILDSVPEYLAAGGNPIIDSVWKFEDAKKAYEKLESGRAVGKIVIELD